MVSSYELTFKLVIIYKYYFQGLGTINVTENQDSQETCLYFSQTKRTVCIQSVSLNSTSEITSNEFEHAILLLGPSQTNETSVRVEDNIIKVSGKSFEEDTRKYTDLDLAVDKILLVLMS